MRLEEIEKKEYIGKGFYSKCYDIGNGKVFKLFNNYMQLSDIEKFKYLLQYKNESFLFPFDFVYDEEKFYGYITKKSLGKRLDRNFGNFDIEKLSTHSILLEHNIKKLSEGKITIEDINETNILYDGEKLEVIDPDFYDKDMKLPLEEIQKRNLKNYKLTITGLLRGNIGYSKKTKYILEKITKYEYTNIPVSEIMIIIKEEMEKYYREKINTIDDLHEILRR